MTRTCLRLRRRQLIPSAIASAVTVGISRPSLVRSASTTTLTFVPYADLALIDPLASALVTRNHVLMVFDTLFGLDERRMPQHQMLAGHTVDAEAQSWTLTLRDGLWFHDGTPVLARDVVASLRRWATRDAMGDALMAATDELSARDDTTIVFRLKRPFPMLPAALGKPTNNIPAIMPERLASLPTDKMLTEIVGSGPFRFLPDEYVSGGHAGFARFDRYKPRQEPASYAAGGHRVMVDRVEWKIIPDAAT